MEQNDILCLINKTHSIKKLFSIAAKYEENLDIAENCYKKICNLDKKNDIAIVMLSTINLKKGEIDFFVDGIFKAYRIKQTNPLTLMYLSTIYNDGYLQRDICKALNYAQLAIKHNKNHIKLIDETSNFIIACCLLESAKTELEIEKAKNILIKAKANTDDQKILKNYLLFNYWLQKNNIEKCSEIAFFFYSKDRFVNKVMQGQIEFSQSNFDKCECILNSALSQNHNNHDSQTMKYIRENSVNIAHFFLGQIYWSNQTNKYDIQKAAKHFKKGAEKGFEQSIINYAYIFYEQKNFEKAISILKTGYENKTNAYAMCLYYAANIYHYDYNKENLSDLDIINLYKRALDLSCFEAAIEIGNILFNKHDYVYAKKMYEIGLNNIQSDEHLISDIKKVKQNYESICDVLNEENKAYKLLRKFLKKYKTNEDLNLAITNWLDQQLLKYANRLEDDIRYYIEISLNISVHLMSSNKTYDFSPAILSLSKAFENFLKIKIVEPYLQYIKRNNINKLSWIKGKQKDILDIFYDDNHTGQLYFTLGSFEHLIKNKNKFDDDFLNFIEQKLNIGNNKKSMYLKNLLDIINSFKNIRDLATHCVSMPIKQYIECLNLLLTDEAIIFKILYRLK